MPARSRDDLLKQLQEQLSFLRIDERLFDDGNEAVAKRMAVVVRLLVHDKGRQRSLLTQSGRLIDLSVIDSATPLGPGQLGWPALLELRMSARGMVFAPRLGAGAPYPYRPFQEWWLGPVDRLPDGRAVSRSEYVLGLAEREGGAHVDPDHDEIYHALGTGNIYGWHTLDRDQPPSEDQPAACVRQITYELLATLTGASAIRSDPSPSE